MITTINTTFGDQLVAHKFPGGNAYSLLRLQSMGLHYGNNIPLIVKSGLHRDEIVFSGDDRQLRGRMLSADKVREVMNTAKVPLICKIGRSQFLIGKGFLARYNGRNNINILFIATVKEDKLASPEVEDISLYISKDVNLSVNKNILAIISPFIKNHKG